MPGGPPRPAMPRISCALPATRRPPLCLDDLLRCRDPSVLLFDPRHHASLAKLIEARHLSHRVLPLLVRKRDPGSDTALPRVKRCDRRGSSLAPPLPIAEAMEVA